MTDFTIQAQADLLRKLLTSPESVVGVHGPYAHGEGKAFHLLDVSVTTPLTEDERKLAELVMSSG